MVNNHNQVTLTGEPKQLYVAVTDAEYSTIAGEKYFSEGIERQEVLNKYLEKLAQIKPDLAAVKPLTDWSAVNRLINWLDYGLQGAALYRYEGETHLEDGSVVRIEREKSKDGSTYVKRVHNTESGDVDQVMVKLTHFEQLGTYERAEFRFWMNAEEAEN